MLMPQEAPAQLALSVGLRDDATFDNFHNVGNEAALAQLDEMLSANPVAFRYMLLWGREDSGRSHLLQAACHATAAAGKRSVFLPMAELAAMNTEVFDNLEHLDLVCIDDIDHVLGQPQWEEALFNVFNRLRNHARMLLISASGPAHALSVDLPDLASRLAWGVTYHLHPLDDQEKLQALKMRARQRGMELPDEVARYILHRGSRAMSGLFATLATLDRASLSAQRKLTIPFVREALGWS